MYGTSSCRLVPPPSRSTRLMAASRKQRCKAVVSDPELVGCGLLRHAVRLLTIEVHKKMGQTSWHSHKFLASPIQYKQSLLSYYHALEYSFSTGRRTLGQ